MIDTTKILAVAQTYQKNRKSVNWDKTADCQMIFNEMIAAGLENCYRYDGVFYGVSKNNKVFILHCDGKRIQIGLYNRIK